MVMKNGYLIMYWIGLRLIDQDAILGKQDAEDCVDAAIAFGSADVVTVHCIDNGEVLYTEEIFRDEDRWYRFTSNNLLGTQSITAL